MGLHAFRPVAQSDGFDRFWSVYPRRHAKRDAMKAWAQLNPDPELVETIVEHIQLRVKSRQWREGFIPLPATFIRGERWEDELTREDFHHAKL